MDGKSIADSILGPVSSLDREDMGAEGGASADEESAEDMAISATADLFMSAIEAKDPTALRDAIRSLATLIRDGG